MIWKQDPLQRLVLRLAAVLGAAALLTGSARAQAEPIPMTLEGHSRVAFSPDGKVLAAPSGKETITLWDASSFEEKVRIPTDIATTRALAFSPDGKVLVIAGEKEAAGKILVWDLKTNKPLQALEGDFGAVYAAAFSSDGKTLASAKAREIRLWDTKGWKEIKSLSVPGNINALALHSASKALAVGSSAKTVKCYDPGTGEEKVSLAWPSQVAAVAYSPGGYYLAVGGRDRKTVMLEAKSGKQLAAWDHKSSVESVAFSVNGKFLAAGDALGVVKVWDVDSRKEIASFDNAGQKPSQASWLDFSPDNKTLACALYGPESAVRVWTLPDAKAAAGQPDKPPAEHHVSADGQVEVSVHDDGSITAANKQTKTEWKFPAKGAEVRGAKTYQTEFAPKGANLPKSYGRALFVLSGTELHCLNGDDGKAVWKVRLAAKAPAKASFTFEDGKVVADLDGTTKTFDMKTGKSLD